MQRPLRDYFMGADLPGLGRALCEFDFVVFIMLAGLGWMSWPLGTGLCTIVAAGYLCVAIGRHDHRWL